MPPSFNPPIQFAGRIVSRDYAKIDGQVIGFVLATEHGHAYAFDFAPNHGNAAGQSWWVPNSDGSPRLATKLEYTVSGWRWTDQNGNTFDMGG